MKAQVPRPVRWCPTRTANLPEAMAKTGRESTLVAVSILQEAWAILEEPGTS